MDSDSTVKNGKKAEVGADEDLVQTGDNKHIGICIGILVAAVIVFWYCYCCKQRRISEK